LILYNASKAKISEGQSRPVQYTHPVYHVCTLKKKNASCRTAFRETHERFK